jgi:c-di-GMP-binding flagellar brake protein YcgR
VAGDERRKYHRLKTEVKVEISYTDLEKDVTSLTTDPVSKDISAGGLLVRQKKHLDVGSEVVVKFLLPSEKRYIMMFARVVRVDVVEKDKLYDIGLCFLNAREHDVSRINKYVADSLDQA